MILKNISIFLIKFYQKHISKHDCKYIPSCSQYTLEAIKKHGFFYGIILGVWRILRCNPFSKGGFDKVPDKKSVVKWVY
ncbi:MAG: membrane protein insertion efficiency factor YidD [Clostridia bacterium]|nr:membrane protein insertion efficiency factor YidD [Clostridia bacterium]